MKKLIVFVSLSLFFGFSLCQLPAQSLQLEYSTYLGGTGVDYGYSVSVDGSGCAFLTGVTKSTDFPTENPYQAVGDGGGQTKSDIFVSKLSSSGSELLYSTYLGGGKRDVGWGVAVDEDGCAYVGGKTQSTDFPTLNPYQASLADDNGDAVMTKISSSGSSLIYSTYLGGSGMEMWKEGGCGVAVESRNAYLAGNTSSNDFPTENAYQGAKGLGYDVFVSKFSSSGSSLVYSTYLGGAADDMGMAIAVDTSLRAYVTGVTISVDFPTLNPYQAEFQGPADEGDAFVSVFASDGSTLVYSTYLGGAADWDEGYGVSVNSTGTAWVTGYTSSDNFPTVNAFQGVKAGGKDIFLSALSSSGSSIVYSTYLGGGSTDEGRAVIVAGDGSVTITGITSSSNFPTKNAYQISSAGEIDAVISTFSSSGDALIYSTYLGGEQNDWGWGIAADSNGAVYAAGFTASSDMPVVNAYQSGTAGNDDAFLSKLLLAGSPTPSPTAVKTPTPPPTPPPTATPVPSASPKLTPSPTATPVPSASPTLTPVPTGTLLPTPHSPLPIIDFNGDGTSDITIFRMDTGLWAVREVTRVYFGGDNDEVVPGDYNGSGTSDMAIFRSSSGLWAIRGVTRIYFGSLSDQPVPADYDGDKICDSGIFRASSGLWAVRNITRAYFGSSGDRPSPGYYDENGTADIAIFRKSSGLWAIRGISRLYFGGGTDRPVPGDYTGDGVWEVGVFRGASGLWAIRQVSRVYFGGVSDAPVPADYGGEGFDAVGIFRGNTGLWALRGLTRVYFGSSGDIPVSRSRIYE